jgi:hypothetical protein
MDLVTGGSGGMAWRAWLHHPGGLAVLGRRRHYFTELSANSACGPARTQHKVLQACSRRLLIIHKSQQLPASWLLLDLALSARREVAPSLIP